MNANQTMQRLEDLKQISQNAEVKLPASIVRDYVDAQSKTDIGFKTESGKEKKQ